jgi:hypothetical protein
MPVQKPSHGEFAKQAVEQFSYNNEPLAQATVHAENESEA